MLCASSQQYEDVNVLRVDDDTIFGGATMRAIFRDVQLCDKRLTAGFTTCHESGGSTLLGYVPYLTSPAAGRELVYAFYNKHTQSVAIVVATSAAHERKAKQLIANFGKSPQSAASVARKALRRCPCKGVQYCDAACQKQHWKVHKLQCTKA